jgi:multidrug efflux pump subunit AcrA (membrane-fusion protein)
VLFAIENTSDLIINIAISEYDIPEVSPNQKCEIIPNAQTDLIYEGIIESIEPTAAKTAAGDDAGSATFKATVAVTSRDTALLVGMTARVNIIMEEAPGALSVSSDLLMSDDGGSFIFAAVESGTTGTEDASAIAYTAKKIYVTLGMETNFYIEVTPVNPGELTEGMLIIVDTDKVTDGQAIEVKSSQSSLERSV